MTFREISGNLFDAPKDFYLAHCISGDYALGAGIAKEFVARQNMKNKLNRQFADIKGEKAVGKALLIDKTFNLVSKEKCFWKPTYINLEETLLDMKRQCLENGIDKIAMPRIGCGLDRLEWFVVEDMIKEIFQDTSIEIVIYVL